MKLSNLLFFLLVGLSWAQEDSSPIPWSNDQDANRAVAIQQFQERNGLKKPSSSSRSMPSLQQVSADNTIQVDGRSISLADEDLIPLDEGRIVVVNDGKEEEVLFNSTKFVFDSRQDDSITVTKGPNGRLLSVTKRSASEGDLELLPVQGYGFYTVRGEDFDEKALSAFTLQYVEPPDQQRRRHLRFHANSTTRDRSLQGTCVQMDVIQVDIVVDSYFCSLYGGRTNAAARATSIVAQASKIYEAFCVKLQLGTIEVHCNSNSDPIRPILDRTGDGNICNDDSSLLEQFGTYVRASNSLNAGLVHLFHAKDFTGVSTVGCAWFGTLCSTSGYNTGVNEMRFTDSLLLSAKIFAHEVGHNFGAQHSANAEDLMYSTATSAGNGFISTTRFTMWRNLDSAQCVRRAAN